MYPNFKIKKVTRKRKGGKKNKNCKTQCKTKFTKEIKQHKKYKAINKIASFFNLKKYVDDELSVACYWTNRGKEGFKLLNELLDDDDCHFAEHKDRFEMNKTHFINKYKFNADGVPDVDVVDVSKNDETQKDVFTINF